MDQLPSAQPDPLPLDEAAEAQRAALVARDVRPVAPGLDQFTTDTLFRDLWLRPDLAPRDRSLVTVSALITAGQVAQVPYHLNRAMDNGLTQAQASEARRSPRLLRRMAQCLLGRSRREGCLRQPFEVTLPLQGDQYEATCHLRRDDVSCSHRQALTRIPRPPPR